MTHLIMRTNNRVIIIIKNALFWLGFKFANSTALLWQSRQGLPQWWVGASFYIFNMIASELDESVLAQTTTLVKSLPLSHGHCTHTNILRVTRSQTQAEEAVPQIMSSTVQREGSWLRRRTEVNYLRTNYTIEDHFHFEVEAEMQEDVRESRSFISSNQDSASLPNHSSHDVSSKLKRGRNKKICLFQKTSINGKNFAKRNTKNIPKNFCKAFGNYMEGLEQSEEWELAMRDVKNIERRSKNKYNNILIHRLLSSPRVCVYFKHFLEGHAVEWINSSKINDKQVHIEAICIYHKLVENLAYAEVDPSHSEE